MVTEQFFESIIGAKFRTEVRDVMAELKENVKRTLDEAVEQVMAEIMDKPDLIATQCARVCKHHIQVQQLSTPRISPRGPEAAQKSPVLPQKTPRLSQKSSDLVQNTARLAPKSPDLTPQMQRWSESIEEIAGYLEKNDSNHVEMERPLTPDISFKGILRRTQSEGVPKAAVHGRASPHRTTHPDVEPIPIPPYGYSPSLSSRSPKDGVVEGTYLSDWTASSCQAPAPVRRTASPRPDERAPRNELPPVAEDPEAPEDQDPILCDFLREWKLFDINATGTGPSPYENDKGWTALTYAAFSGRADVVRILLAREDFTGVGALTSPIKSSALTVACTAGHTGIVQLLLGCDRFPHVNTPNYLGSPPLMAAVAMGHLKCLPLLLADPRTEVNKRNHAGATAMTTAVSFGRLDITDLLLTNAAVDVNARLLSGQSGLHLVPTAEIAHALLRSQRIQDVNAMDNEGRTALHCAVINNRPDVVRALLSSARFTEVNSQDCKGRTALHEAAQKGKSEVVRILLANSGDIDLLIKDNDGMTASEMAKRGGHLAVFHALCEQAASSTTAPSKAVVQPSNSVGETPVRWASLRDEFLKVSMGSVERKVPGLQIDLNLPRRSVSSPSAEEVSSARLTQLGMHYNVSPSAMTSARSSAAPSLESSPTAMGFLSRPIQAGGVVKRYTERGANLQVSRPRTLSPRVMVMPPPGGSCAPPVDRARTVPPMQDDAVPQRSPRDAGDGPVVAARTLSRDGSATSPRRRVLEAPRTLSGDEGFVCY